MKRHSGQMVTVRDLFDGEPSDSRTGDVDGRRIVLQIVTLAVAVLTLLASAFGQAPRWFQWVAAAFAVVVGVWATSQLLSRLRDLRASYRDRAVLAQTVKRLNTELSDLLDRFTRYADNNRSDTIPRLLIQLVMQEKIELPIADTSLYHIWRLHEILRDRAGLVTGPAGFRNVAQQFGEILHLYHSLYVLKPYERLRTLDLATFSSYAQTVVRGGLSVFREDYNDFIRLSNLFGEKVNAAFGGNVYPAYLERLKPVVG